MTRTQLHLWIIPQSLSCYKLLGIPTFFYAHMPSSMKLGWTWFATYFLLLSMIRSNNKKGGARMRCQRNRTSQPMTSQKCYYSILHRCQLSVDTQSMSRPLQAAFGRSMAQPQAVQLTSQPIATGSFSFIRSTTNTIRVKSTIFEMTYLFHVIRKLRIYRYWWVYWGTSPQQLQRGET